MTMSIADCLLDFETLPQTDDFRRAAVESTHSVQSVRPIARWKAK